MKSIKYSAIVFLLLFHRDVAAQKVRLTPEKKIKLFEVPVIIPPQFLNNVPSELKVKIPAGFKASVFYAGKLSKCRFMCWGPDSTLYIANMNSGEVLALPDKNHDLIADTAIVVISGAYGHDVKYFRDALYVAEELKVEKFVDTDKDGIFETRSIFIDTIMGGKKRPPGGHTTRTLVFDEKKNSVYLSVGSSCNICREEGRALIFQYDLEGKNKKIYASGARNCVGMTLDPAGNLWATNNGSDHQGEDIPPEWIDQLQEGEFCGYPFVFDAGKYFDFNAHKDYRQILPITSSDSALVRSMKAPSALVQAHSAPMAIEFAAKPLNGKKSKGAFVAYRGSWDRKVPVGYKVAYLDIDKNNKVKTVSDFVTGFLGEDGKPWARPVGLLNDKEGNLFLSSDDLNQFILVISKK